MALLYPAVILGSLPLPRKWFLQQPVCHLFHLLCEWGTPVDLDRSHSVLRGNQRSSLHQPPQKIPLHGQFLQFEFMKLLVETSQSFCECRNQMVMYLDWKVYLNSSVHYLPQLHLRTDPHQQQIGPLTRPVEVMGSYSLEPYKMELQLQRCFKLGQ